MRYMGPMFYENWLDHNDLDADGNCISTDIVYAQVPVRFFVRHFQSIFHSLEILLRFMAILGRTVKSKLPTEMFDSGILVEIQFFVILIQVSM